MVLEAANILHVRTIKYSFFCHRYVSLWSYRNATFRCCHLDATIENAMCIARRTTTPPRVAQQTIRWDRIDSGAQIKHQLQISQHFHFAHPQITVDGEYICTRNTLAENKHRVRTAYGVLRTYSETRGNSISLLDSNGFWLWHSHNDTCGHCCAWNDGMWICIYYIILIIHIIIGGRMLIYTINLYIHGIFIRIAIRATPELTNRLRQRMKKKNNIMHDDGLSAVSGCHSQ